MFHLSFAPASIAASMSSCREDRTYVRGAAGVTVRQLESLVRHPKLEVYRDPLVTMGFTSIWNPKMAVFIVYRKSDDQKSNLR